MNKYQGFKFFMSFAKSQFCYYRTTLSERERIAYDEILDGFLSFSKNIYVSNVSIAQVQYIFEKIKLDNPWLFYVDKASYQFLPESDFGSLIPVYRFDKNQIDAILLSLANKCTLLTANIKNKSDSEKEEFIHDWFCRDVIYDDAFKDSSFECVGPLLFKKGVCEGISKAAKLLFDFVNMESLVVCGVAANQANPSSSEAHAWNMVKINDSFYHLDITFDMTIGMFGIVRHDYFNLSDEDISFDHEITSGSVPVCRFNYCYYKKNQMYMQTQSDYRKYLVDSVKKNQKDIVFKLPNGTDFNETKNKVVQITTDVLENTCLFLSQYMLITNEAQNVFHLHFG